MEPNIEHLKQALYGHIEALWEARLSHNKTLIEYATRNVTSCVEAIASAKPTNEQDEA